MPWMLAACCWRRSATVVAERKLTFQTASSNGVLQKTTAEDWKGTVLATGTATFFRYYIPGDSDDGTTADTAATYKRIQGNVGEDMTFDMELPSPDLVANNTQAISQFQIGWPT